MEKIISIKCICPLCGKNHIVKVKKSDYDAWQNGALIQRAFPYLSASEREYLMTGLCNNCFNKL